MTKDTALPERTQLAELPLVSLDEPGETEVESLWVEAAGAGWQNTGPARPKHPTRTKYFAGPSPIFHKALALLLGSTQHRGHPSRQWPRSAYSIVSLRPATAVFLGRVSSSTPSL
jgi:hypothetical protein